ADPPLPSDRWRLGFSISNPIDWNPPSVGTVVTSQTAQPPQELRLSGNGSLGTLVPAIAAGVSALPHLRLRASVALSRVSYSQPAEVAVLSTSATAASVDRRDATLSGTSNQLRVTVGAQWDIIPALTVGLVAVTPGLTISSGGRLSGETGSYSGT